MEECTKQWNGLHYHVTKIVAVQRDVYNDKQHITPELTQINCYHNMNLPNFSSLLR